MKSPAPTPDVRHLKWLHSTRADDLPQTVTGARYLLLTQMIGSLFTVLPLMATSFVLNYPSMHVVLTYNPAQDEITAVICIFFACAFLACCASFLGSLEEWARSAAITLEGIIMIGSLALITGGEKIGTLSLVLALLTLPFLVARSTRDACFFSHASKDEISRRDALVYQGYMPPSINTPRAEMPMMTVAGHAQHQEEPSSDPRQQ